MKVKELINHLEKLQPDGDIYVAKEVEKYMEIEINSWNNPDDGDLYIIYPGKLVFEISE